MNRPEYELGLYEIVAPLGAGGTGEVYRATDTKLDRAMVPMHASPAGEARPHWCSSATPAFPFKSIDPALLFGLIRP